MCPFLPPGLLLNATTCPSSMEDPQGGGMLAEFKAKFHPLEACPGSLAKWGNHVGVGDSFEEEYRGHGVIMMRQPEERLISSYNHFYHGWQWDLWGRAPSGVVEYARAMSGCVTQMLTGTGKHLCGGNASSAANEDTVRLAKQRLRGLVFVGLTEEWELSACLWRAKFGGRCLKSDLENIRPSVPTPDIPPFDPATVPDLGGYRDPHDGDVYREAASIFREELQLYGLNRTICRQCY
eukprot:CAMPEP_0179315256 /NCGR_PEP_ID=MMETSP0797-20121207/54952_1 /TAXON_ID=47934 /ORGANISM="Dinophysis acuminata, Strain DAEP01" /LENGTH=236 /DNA_ID=CAMNT_0021025743 /DNA_START=67 /DNA_END=774 /DNA_ORIENTATION=-